MNTMPDILEKILAATKLRVAEEKRRVSVAELERSIFHSPLGFSAALRRGSGVIAELKKASPSKGLIRMDFSPAPLAVELAGAGADALSVLTEPDFFLGSMRYLEQVRPLVKIPLLRKDFVYDEYQIVQAAAAGADAVLLIRAMLPEKRFVALLGCAREFHLDALCEVHDREEFASVTGLGATLIGVNARNLRTFAVSPEESLGLIAEVRSRSNATLVAESAIHSAAELTAFRNAGANGFLIGECLMRSISPGTKLKELLS